MLVVVIAGLALSGLTAFPIQTEMNWLVSDLIGVPHDASPHSYGAFLAWLVTVRNGINATYASYPWLAYGFDWLAFAHLMLAILFWGAWRDPVKNIWVVEFGLIACVLVLPLALICGPIRGIPFFWRVIDCSFGLIAFPFLWGARAIILAMSD